jgi:hypothetical protein
MRFAALLVLCAAGTAALPAQARVVDAYTRSAAEAPPVPAAEVRQVRANIAGRVAGWRGVRSCDEQRRARAALETAFNAWIGAQVRENSNLRVLRSGWEASAWQYHNGRHANGARFCTGGFITAPVFVDFY